MPGAAARGLCQSRLAPARSRGTPNCPASGQACLVELSQVWAPPFRTRSLERDVTDLEAIRERREQLLQALGADATAHGDRRLLDHLRGVHALLYRWRGDDAVSRAGLFHSIYGSQAFPVSLASPVDRLRVRAVIGEKSEAIAYAFGRCDRGLLLSSGPCPAQFVDRITGELIDLNFELLQALLEIEAANMLEQTPPIWRLDADIREALPAVWTPQLALLSSGARGDLLAYLQGELSVRKIRDRAGIPISDQAGS